jgi:sugar (pentulose or hexulose) kinase
MDEHLGEVDVIALSGTTPGLTAMDGDGNALYPAILMLDQRSSDQAAQIIETVGLQKLLDETGNMPVAGGCSLASILWIKENLPEVFDRTRTFGHSNTYMARWLTGRCAMDPSSASLTALYNTVRNDLTWNEDIAGAVGLSADVLPDLIPACESAGTVLGPVARELGLRKAPPVVIGGNDAVLAAYSVGIEEPGDVINVNGTCEITLVCLPRCLSSTKYNVRAHVVPARWLTLHVMNAGGKALEWFRAVFCSGLEAGDFYDRFLPEAVERWLDRTSGVTYVPYLMGSRYSLEPLKAAFTGLTQETTREEMAAALVRGLCRYQRAHLNDIGSHVALKETIHVTGGALNDALIRAKNRWMRHGDYRHEEQSSLKGAALLGKRYLEGS